MSLNLHQIVRGAISSVNADEQVYIIRSTGNANIKGRIQATYATPELITAQVQTLSNDDLKIVNETERTERDRKFYLFSDPDYNTSPASIIRYLGRTGDFIYRPFDQTYWKIYCVAEDFAPVGWVQVLASQQIETPTEVVALIEQIINPPQRQSQSQSQNRRNRRMNDIMDAVYDFIKTYAYDPNDESLPQYADDQIIRAGLNEASAPKAKTEMCIIIHLGTIRHGTNHYQLHNAPSDALHTSTSELVEHIVQVDMLSAEPLIRQAVTARRAQLIEMIARSPMAVDFFKSKGFNILFAEDVTVINQWDDTKNYTARYSVKLRLEEVVTYTVNSDYFTKVKVKSVRAHTADTRANEPGYLLTENIDNNHL